MADMKEQEQTWITEAAYRSLSGGSKGDVLLKPGTGEDPKEKEKRLIERVLGKYDGMVAERATLESHWEEIARFFYPRRQGYTSTRTMGEKRGQDLYDATGPVSLELLASALQSMLTNPSVPWFGIGVFMGGLPVKNKAVGMWASDVEIAVHETLRNTNFHTQAHELYLDLGHVGTACMYVGDHPDDVLFFDTRHMGEVYIAADARGVVDTVVRKFEYTARQAVMEWGDAVSEKVQAEYLNAPETKRVYLHCVMPRWERDPKAKDSKNLPWASLYIELETRRLLEESGFHENPYITPRWSLASGEQYGRSQAMTALPWVKQLNAMEKTTIAAQQLSILPPIFAPDDGFLINPRPIPGSINYYRGTNPQDKLFPWPQGSKFDVVLQEKMELRDVIRKTFFIDQLQLREGPQMTATEVMQRTEEQQRLLGPVLGRMHSEFLAKLMTRVLGIMHRKKMLPAYPGELQDLLKNGAHVKVEYVSPIAKSMRTFEGQAIMKSIQAVGVIAQIDPAVMDRLDTDEAAKRLFDIFGAPAGIVRSDTQVKKVREARAQAEQEQLAAAQAATQAEAMSKLLPAASQSVEPGSVMAQAASPVGSAMLNQG